MKESQRKRGDVGGRKKEDSSTAEQKKEKELP